MPRTTVEQARSTTTLALRRDNLRRPACVDARFSRDEDGAAMLIVMFVLLMTTATATFAVHVTSSEIQSAGQTQQAIQTEYVAEAGMHAAISLVERHGPVSMQTVMGGRLPPEMHPYEPALAPGRMGCRLAPRVTGNEVAPAGECYLEVLSTVDHNALGPRQPRAPYFMVDASDVYEETATIPGNRADGGGRIRRLHVTYTARGRTRLPEEASAMTMTGGSMNAAAYARAREANETMSNARAYWLSQPFGG